MDFFFSSSQLPSNFSYVGDCQDVMAIWLSYLSRWLALFYAETHLQNLICLIVLEALGIRFLKILIHSLPKGWDVPANFFLNLAFERGFLSFDSYT